MRTYQDLIEVGQDEEKRMEFCLSAITEHQASERYHIAQDADAYYRHLNPTIMRAQKLIHDVFGRSVPDIYSANNKIPSRYYFQFVTQETQTLLSYGVDFGKETTKPLLGADIDYKVQKAAVHALNAGVSFGYVNLDHIEVFSLLEFVPLYDEENGSLRAGIRFWSLDADKPFRVVLYEEDGVTEYIRRKGEKIELLKEKTAYVLTDTVTEAGGVEITESKNYGRFPIIPLYNANRQSEIVGGREQIDAYDLMLSQLINNVSDGSVIYWVLKNCGGMSEEEMTEYVTRLARTHVSRAGDNEGSVAEPHTVNVPYEASAEALDRLRRELYDSFMALDIREIAAGATTATQIRAAYEPLMSKCDLFEAEIDEFLRGILAVLGIEDEPQTFKRSTVSNNAEETDMILSSAVLIGEEEAIRRLPWLSPEEADTIIAERRTTEQERTIPDIGEEEGTDGEGDGE